MAKNATRLEAALSLALNLSPRDRLKLVERVVSSVENDMAVEQPSATRPTTGQWGAEVIALLNQLDLTEWEHLDIPDVGDWVHQMRHDESEHHARAWKDNA